MWVVVGGGGEGGTRSTAAGGRVRPSLFMRFLLVGWGCSNTKKRKQQHNEHNIPTKYCLQKTAYKRLHTKDFLQKTAYKRLPTKISYKDFLQKTSYNEFLQKSMNYKVCVVSPRLLGAPRGARRYFYKNKNMKN